MRIHSLSKVLGIPLGIMLVGALYAMVELRIDHAWMWLILPLVGLTLLFVFHGQIDYWWTSRDTPPLDPPIKDWLLKYDSYYAGLDEETRAKFDKRMVMYMHGRAFKSVGSEMHNVPNDIQGIISSVPVRMMLHLDDVLLGDMDHIYLYKHPFPSPKRQYLHTAETDMEDGVIILSLEHAIPGVMNPNAHYNITLHAFAEAYQQVFAKHNFSYLDNISWAELKQIGPFTEAQVQGTLGYKDFYISTVAIHHFFCYSKQFEAVLPRAYAKLRIEFNIP